ncbi:MAG: hypothetical protein LUQ59_03425 [Methanothrix sp.]|nr:hypothetical protein [Methanothrix sp.]
MNRGEVQRYIEARFPGTKVKSKMTIHCRNSRIFRLDVSHGKTQDKIVVKISRNYQPEEVALEYTNLSRFYNGCRSEAISSPRPMFVDEEKGILAMSCVPGSSLAVMLHEIKPVSQSYLNSAVDLSARALAEYHALFSRDEGESISIDHAAREDDINQFLAKSRTLIEDCSLKTMVTPFFDFTPWNIIIEDSPSMTVKMLYLIDFPRRDYVSTPHLDFARFRFSLELIKQFPPARFLGINRWDVDLLFDRFLKGYCREMQAELNKNDLSLIALGRIAYIRRAQDLGRKGRRGWQPTLEQAYLQTFSRQWLDQKGTFSQWPRLGRAEKV